MAKILKILLVDDDETDRELFRTALESCGDSYHLMEAEQGEAAIKFLDKLEELPNVIILDLNMPVKDGRETLKELKAHPVYNTIPVGIMSTSSAQFDIMHAYQNGANFFLMKPFDFNELKEMTGLLLQLFRKYIFLPDGLKKTISHT